MPTHVSGTFTIPEDALVGMYNFTASGGGISCIHDLAFAISNLNILSIFPNFLSFQNQGDNYHEISLTGDNAFVMGEPVYIEIFRDGYPTIKNSTEYYVSCWVQNENLVTDIGFTVLEFSPGGYWNLRVTHMGATITIENAIEFVVDLKPQISIFYHDPEFNEGVTVSGEIHGLGFTPDMTGYMTDWSETEYVPCNVNAIDTQHAIMSVTIPDGTYGQYWKLYLNNGNLMYPPKTYRIGGPLE